MLNRKEFTAIIVATLVLAFCASLITNLKTFPYVLLSILIIILVNTIAKKIAAYHCDSEIKVRLWEIERYGYKASWRFKKPVPAGLIFPLFFTIISLGYIKWLAALVFDVTPKPYRAAKRHGLYRFSEMTESHIGFIAAAGIVTNLVVAVAAYLIPNIPVEMDFVRLSIFFAFFSMLPFSDLDGNKIFFGSMVLWSFLAAIVLIAMAFAFLIV